MSLQMGFGKKLELRTDKVKSVDIHPVEPWVASALYNGSCTIYNYSTQSLVKKIDISDLPLRCCKFVARKQWIIAAGDKMCIWVYNYNSLEKVQVVEGHKDYVRYLDLHSTMPYVLSSSDDMTIILWDIDKNWEKLAVYEGHSHYVMMAKWSPKDMNIFASCSLDHTIMFWGISQESADIKSGPKSFFSLSGHEKGVNCIDFTTNISCPYIISGSDDCTIRVWDYQTKLCLQVLKQHSKAVMSVLYHPRLPIILSCGEDGDFNVWHSNLYKIKRCVNYGYGKLWSIAGNSVDTAIASDSGTCVIQLAGDKPLVSMYSNKLVMVKSSDIMICNLNTGMTVTEEAARQPLNLSFRSIGSCEFFPQSVSHHPNGRFICLCGDSEYIIYTSQGMKSKSYGKASQLVWSEEGDYATYDGLEIALHRDFALNTTFKPSEQVVKLHGGKLLGVSTTSSTHFYRWTDGMLIKTIDVQTEHVWWNEGSSKLALGCVGTCYILAYNEEAVAEALDGGDYNPEMGVGSSFDLEKEIVDRVTSATWAMETFLYITPGLHLNMFVAGTVETLAYLDKPLHMIGYSSESSLLYLCDDAIYAHPLELEYLNFHALVSQIGEQGTQKVTEAISELSPKLKERASKFLESIEQYKLSLLCTSDPDRKFELNLKLGNVEDCLDLLSKETSVESHRGNKLLKRQWKRLGDYCLENSRFDVATTCFGFCNDFSNLLLLHTITGNKEGIENLAESAHKAGSTNIAFTCYYMLNNIEKCVEILHASNCHSEATIMARTFKPSLLKDSFDIWKKNFNNSHIILDDPPEDNGRELEKTVEKRLEAGFPDAQLFPKFKDAVYSDFGASEPSAEPVETTVADTSAVQPETETLDGIVDDVPESEVKDESPVTEEKEEEEKGDE